MEGFNHYRPSSSQDTVQHKRKYHVFLSFRGLDTRKSLVDHLFQSLAAVGFHVFLDSERLEKGENIGISLEDAIGDSTVHIPIFSSNYASSPWCLRELSLIWTYKSTYPETQTIPLFYDVEPSVVRYETGTYAESLKALCAKGRHSPAEIIMWKEALHNVSRLSGWSLSLTANGYEGKLVKHVVMDLLRTLKIDRMHVVKHPVGLSDPIEEVTKLLEIDNDILRLTLGIWGIGGIGKTTLAKAVCNNIHHLFQASCFVSNIRATANESVKGLVKLQRQILQELVYVNAAIYSVAHGIMQMKTHLASAKVLVILDDVDDIKQLDALAGNCYGPGSRIIITTRDKKVLRLRKIDKIYRMTGLSQHEGVQLFSFHAFLRASPENGYEYMTEKIVNACQGVPLLLENLGSHLYGERNMGIWGEALKIFQKSVYPSLKISYDALSHEEQQMFLDIACFFVIISNEYLFKNMTFYLDFWRAVGCKTVHASLRSLEEKALMRIDDSGSHCRFWMHDHLRDLGRQIVEDESPHDPSKRSRLWCKKDILSVLEHTEEMPEVRGLMLTELELYQMDNLALMHNLKFLFCWELFLKREISMFPRDLRYLVLSRCAMIDGSSGKYISLPTKLGQLQSLCYLDIRETALADLPSEVGLNWMQSLRELTLSHCENLEELPPLPESLIHIEVEDCPRLQKVSNMSHMIKLETLRVSRCYSMAQLPELNWMQSLIELTLSHCENLEELPPLPESLIHIEVEDCPRLQKLSSMSHMIKLETLHVSRCYSLAQLPELNWMPFLRELRLSHCEDLEELPPLPESLIHIEVEDCPRLQKLCSMSHMIKLETLHLSRCYSFARLPELNWMQSLRELRLSHCENLEGLPPLPESLIHMKVEDCHRLQKLSSMSHMIKLETLHLSRCYSFVRLPELNSMQSLREFTLSYCENLKELPPLPKGLLKLTLYGCENLKELPPVPEGLINLSIPGCHQLRINAFQPSTRDKGKHMTPEPNNETDPSAMRYFPKRSRNMEPAPCFSVQNFLMEQGKSSVPPPAVPDYEIPHNVDTALP